MTKPRPDDRGGATPSQTRERSQTTAVVNGVAGIVIVVCVPWLAAASRLPGWGEHWAIGVPLLLGIGLVLWLNRRGRQRAAVWLMIPLVWAGVTALAWASAELQGPAYAAYTVVILIAGLLLGGRAAFGAAAASAFVVAGFDLLHIHSSSHAPSPGYLPVSPIAAFAVAAGGAAALSAVAASRIRRREAELEASRERFRALVENARDFVAEIDAEGRYHYVSPNYAKLLDQPVAQLIGRTAFEFMHPEDVTAAGRALGQLMLDGTAFETTLRMRAGEGGWRWLQSRGDALRAASAEPRIVVISRDVTEQRALEAQQRHSQKMEAMGRLAGGIAHDFNNLLTAISGFSELLLSQLRADDAAREAAEEIREAAARAATLTRQLLVFGRGQLLRSEVLDLREIVSGLGEMLVRLIGEDVLLRFDLDPELAAVQADRGQIEQIVVNLVVNAREAMPRGGTLRIASRPLEIVASDPGELAPGRYVALSFTDTGHGMDEDTALRVFDPFFTTRGDAGGSGLGLATAYGIARQSGGTIRVRSRAGLGSTFELLLPAVAARPAAPALRPAPAPEPAVRPRDLTLLLVEDDAPVRGLLARALRSEGYRVVEAAGGEQALAAAGAIQGPVDVLVADVVMPGMSGLALWEHLRVRRPETRVLFMSGYAEERARAHGGLPEGAALIQKPFRPSELDRAVRELVADAYPDRSRKIGDDQARSETGATQSSPGGVRSSA